MEHQQKQPPSTRLRSTVIPNGSSSEAGLTLIEVLIVVSILVVILAVVIPNYASSTKRAQTKLCHSTQMMVEAQIELYRLDQKHVFADSTNPTDDIFKRLKADGYVRELPTCPAGGTFTWKDNKLICSDHGHHGDEHGEQSD